VLSPVSPFGTAFNPSVTGSLNTGRLERSRWCGGRFRVWLIRHLRLPG
jgi:hypothetical protein